MQRHTLIRSFTRGVRQNSTLANVIANIRSGGSVDRTSLTKALSDRKFSDSEIQSLHEVLRSDVEHDIANEILHHGLAHDFSLYFTAAKREKLAWNDRSLESLIKYNPGRAFSSLHLLKKHGEMSASDAVFLTVVEKLLLGEKSERTEQSFVPSDKNVSEAISFFNRMANLSTSEPLLNTLIDVLEEKDMLPLLSSLKFDGFYSWLCSSRLANATDNRKFLQLSQLVFNHDPALLSKITLSKMLSIAADVEDLSSPALKDSSKPAPQSKTEFLASVLEYVEKNALDMDKKDPESLLLRIQLIESYGIHNDDVDSASRKFHEYQTHEKYGIELVQARLVKVYCYQAFKTQSEIFLKIAETLVSPEELAVSTIAQLILAKGRFSSDQSLDLYKDYINQVSKTTNENTGRSPAGVLTEAVMVANLYDNDREFAQLLYEKAISSGVISNEHEIAMIKKVLKAYGDSFVENDWKVAQPIFGEYVLKCIRNA